MKLARITLLAAALTLVAASFAATADSAAPAPVQARETFAAIWERLQSSGFNGQHEGLDWAALKAKHQPEIEAASDLTQLRREIRELLSDLKASHLELLPAEMMQQVNASIDAPAAGKSNDTGADDAAAGAPGATGAPKPPAGGGSRDYGALGLRLTLAGDRLLVTRVVDGQPAGLAGIRPGWELLQAGGFNAEIARKSMLESPPTQRRQNEVMFAAGAQALLGRVHVGDALSLVFRDATGKRHETTLTAVADPDVQPMGLPGLPPLPLRFSRRALPTADGGCALYVEFTQWGTPVYPALLAALREHPDCRGVIIDLRGNSGGIAFSIGAIGGLFVDTPTSLGTQITRDDTLRLMALPRQVDDAGNDIRRHTGPLAILVDRSSVSCSDIFPAGMQAIGRARIFGSPSAGMALPAASMRLPSGDYLLYPIADYVDPSGRRIEGVGVIPDDTIVPTVAQLSSGRDPVVDAAVGWIGRSVTTPSTTAGNTPR